MARAPSTTAHVVAERTVDARDLLGGPVLDGRAEAVTDGESEQGAADAVRIDGYGGAPGPTASPRAA